MMCHYRRQFRTDCAVLVAAKEMQDAAQKCPSFDAAFERLSRIVLPPPPPPFHPATAFPPPFFFSNSFWPAIFYYYQQALLKYTYTHIHALLLKSAVYTFNQRLLGVL
jgi:hypothetical protein